MKNIKYILYNGKKEKNPKEILNILKKENFNWLIDSELDSAELEINKNTLIWHGGDFIFGDWIYGIFKSGSFYGRWENGIFEDGDFKGTWISGIFK